MFADWRLHIFCKPQVRVLGVKFLVTFGEHWLQQLSCRLQSTERSLILTAEVFRKLLSITSFTLWSYKLILNHLLKYRTKFHYIDFVWPLTPSSLMDIWHLVSNKQVICKKCLEMAIRKKVRFLGLAQIYLFLMDKFLKKKNLCYKKVFIIG